MGCIQTVDLQGCQTLWCELKATAAVAGMDEPRLQRDGLVFYVPESKCCAQTFIEYLRYTALLLTILETGPFHCLVSKHCLGSCEAGA